MELVERDLIEEPLRLEPLRAHHHAGLGRAVEADTTIWDTLYPFSMAGAHFEPFMADLARKRAAGYAMPFAVLQSGEVVGLTCYLRINPAWCSLDIGSTYHRPDVRGGVVNPLAKLLLLDHAFACGARRVQFRVDALNTRSRAAVLKLGAVEEGTLRREKPTWTGRLQDTVIFSILDDEWPERRPALRRRVDGLSGRSPPPAFMR